MPHWHHEDRVYTVISGVFYIGLGEQFEEEKLQAYPPGAVVVLPGGTRHFHWAKSGEYVTQVTAVGPISLEYADPRVCPITTAGLCAVGWQVTGNGKSSARWLLAGSRQRGPESCSRERPALSEVYERWMHGTSGAHDRVAGDGRAAVVMVVCVASAA